jgi:alkaline phosphatase
MRATLESPAIRLILTIIFLLAGCSSPQETPISTHDPKLEPSPTIAEPTPTDESEGESPPMPVDTEMPSVELAPSARNVILLIGDGMGEAQRKAAQWISKGMSGELVMDSLPVYGWSKTASLDSPITDSPASATAMATGKKTYKGRVAMDPDGNSLKTILEFAQEHGKSVGLITTVFLSDATPAAFAAHVPDRMTMRNEIAAMILEHQVDVLLGGGEDDFLPTSHTGCYAESGHREDGRNLVEEAISLGYVYICDAEAFADIDASTTSKVLGLFSDEQMIRPFSPSLAEMTQKAIEILSKNAEGFFLMVEGGLIDWACHANNAQTAMDDTHTFDEAVAVALAFAEADEETLLIVTADHETGGMSVDLNSSGNPGEDGPFSMPDGKSFYVNWTSDYHTAADVPVSAMGPGADLLSGTYENSHIFNVMYQALFSQSMAEPEDEGGDELIEESSQLPSWITDPLIDPQLLFHDGLETLTEGWYFHENSSVSDGIVTISADGNWESYWTNNYELSEGRASILLFKFDANADFTLGHKISEFGQEDYFFWGINEDTDKFVMQADVYDDSPLQGTLLMEPHTWYYALFAIGDDADFLIRIWERDDPSNWAENRYSFGEEWADRGWWFSFSLGDGEVNIDEYYSLSFSGYR